ncbi:cAMP-specific 3',5'-cyclic phosphodiesterase 4D [Lonchura striata]|uniref:cAMP-specific 3',5'-cyclic phosphodiesterase 4D n=1 Tax=Lonchura striata TaxID=40157 RepID=A0A218VAE0_9PASE|nr:cAMP-specific 3',5'-cyclic phosphodiesterase 4D [Lonchura striata domestica]
MVSEEALHQSTEDEEPSQGMEPYLVRRLSSRNIQLPPLAFRQLEQADWDKKNDNETIPRPMTLPLRIPPLIAITAAESSSYEFPIYMLIMPAKQLEKAIILSVFSSA